MNAVAPQMELTWDLDTNLYPELLSLGDTAEKRHAAVDMCYAMALEAISCGAALRLTGSQENPVVQIAGFSPVPLYIVLAVFTQTRVDPKDREAVKSVLQERFGVQFSR